MTENKIHSCSVGYKHAQFIPLNITDTDITVRQKGQVPLPCMFLASPS